MPELFDEFERKVDKLMKKKYFEAY